MESTPVLSPSRPSRPERVPPPAQPRRMTRWFMLLGLLTLGGSITVASLSLHPLSHGKDSAAPPARGERRAVAVAYVDVEGGVRPLYPAVPGRVVDAPVPEGKEVEAGTVVLRIDDALAQAKLEEAQIAYEAAKENLAEAKKRGPQHQTTIDIQQASLDAARRDMEAAEVQVGKLRRLVGGNLDSGKDDIKAAEKLVEKAKAAVRAEEGKLSLAKSLDPEAKVRLATFD